MRLFHKHNFKLVSAQDTQDVHYRDSYLKYTYGRADEDKIVDDYTSIVQQCQDKSCGRIVDTRVEGHHAKEIMERAI